MSNWERIIKDKLEDARQELPAGDWEILQARRAGQVRRQTWRKVMWWAAPSAAAALALLLILPRLSEKTPLAREDALAHIEPATGIEPTTAAFPVILSEAKDPADPSAVPRDDKQKPLIDNAKPVRPTREVSRKNTGSAPSVTESFQMFSGPEQADPEPDKRSETPASSTPIDEIPAEPARVEERLRAEGRLASTRPERKLTVTAGGLLAALHDNAPHSLPMMDAANPTYASSSTGSHTGVARIPDLRKIAAIAVATDQLVGTRHQRPLEFGLTAGIPLGERWTVVTGLEYALYRSQYSYSQSGSREQRAHYLGIPVQVDFNLVNRKNLRLYLGAGAKADWGLAANRGTEKIRPDGFGASLQALGGLQWNLTPTLGLYLEPRYSWFLSDPEGRIQTFRTESPRLFSLSAGLRLHL